jgi:hypothetical protein
MCHQAMSLVIENWDKLQIHIIMKFWICKIGFLDFVHRLFQ